MWWEHLPQKVCRNPDLKNNVGTLIFAVASNSNSNFAEEFKLTELTLPLNKLKAHCSISTWAKWNLKADVWIDAAVRCRSFLKTFVNRIQLSAQHRIFHLLKFYDSVKKLRPPWSQLAHFQSCACSVCHSTSPFSDRHKPLDILLSFPVCASLFVYLCESFS